MLVKIPTTDSVRLQKLFERQRKASCGRPSDYVTYTAVGEGGRISRRGAACFANLRGWASTSPSWEDWEVTLPLPVKKEGSLSADEVFSLLQELTEAGLVREGAQVWEEEGKPHIKIPPGAKKEKHLQYASLCVARWLQTRPLLFRHYRELQESEPHVTCYQLLPLLMGMWSPNTGHSFFYATYRHPDHVYDSATSFFIHFSLLDFGIHPDRLDLSRRYMTYNVIQNRAALRLAASRRSLGEEPKLRYPTDILHPSFSALFRKLMASTEEESWELILHFLQEHTTKETSA